MVDVDSALLSVQERDNWRRRMEVLERSLVEIRGQRRRLEARLRRVRKELDRIRLAAEAVLDFSKPLRRQEMIRVPSPVALHNR
jgi:septal ring factor EnvC (AmiA/AmiB activator)